MLWRCKTKEGETLVKKKKKRWMGTERWFYKMRI